MWSQIILILSVASTITAHGWIDSWTINNKNYTGFNPSSAPWIPDQNTIAWPSWNENLGPVSSNATDTTDIICSINATNAKIAAASIAAGSTISLHWATWPVFHPGPIMSYLAACNGSCSSVDKTQLKWFKIAELGQLSLGAGNGMAGVWASDILALTNGTWSVKIPSSIKAGSYVLRNEILALHGAYDVGAAQFYPTCANIEITGNGTNQPVGAVGTQLYTAEDPGVHYNIYHDEMMPTYPMPGPALCQF